jgi:glycosyltransferase involved in cell wall biosynthesis
MSSPAGTERVTSVLANQLSRSGYEVDIITLTLVGSYFELDKRINLYALGATSDVRFLLLYPWYILKLYQLVLKRGYDIFINVAVMMIYASWIVKLMRKCKVISWEHYNIHIRPRPFISAWSRKLALALSDKIVLLTRKDEELYRELLKDSDKLQHIPNPVTINSSDKGSPENQQVLAIGRYTAQKGFDLLLDAWSIVCSKVNDWTLQIVGDGEDREMLLQKAESLEIADKVIFTAPTNKVIDAYKQASFYVLSSRFEGMPLVLLEAMHMGLPLVAFDCEYGPAELIIPNYNGLLVENGNSHNLADAMLELIFNKDKRISMSHNALQISEKYSISNVTNQWIDLIDALTSFKS